MYLEDNDILENERVRSRDGTETQLSWKDLTLKRAIQPGTLVEVDVSCDSAFMLQVMPKLGRSIRQSMEHFPLNEPIFLQLDNAGGHGTKKAIGEYTGLLRAQFNIIVKFQPPRSPELNALDNGIWMSLQSHVEKKHRHRTITNDSIALSVQEAWDHLPSSTISKVFDRLPTVHQLIVEDRGGNSRVQERRGLRNRADQDL